MMFSKGYGAEETRTAFAEALRLAAGTADAAGRFAAYFGIWTGSVDRGDLMLARRVAETFRREAEHEGQAPSLARACVCLGLTLLTEGKLGWARAQLEEALKTYDPGWDREAKLGFGSDVGTLASAYLANASWLLGDIACARELIEQALARAIQSEHVAIVVFIYTRQALLEAVRGDAEATLPLAETVIELSQEYRLALYLAWGKAYRGWARARLGDREAGVLPRGMHEQSHARPITLGARNMRDLPAGSRDRRTRHRSRFCAQRAGRDLAQPRRAESCPIRPRASIGRSRSTTRRRNRVPVLGR
jgi:hypothetical protein